MYLNFTLVPKRNYVPPTPPPVGDFHPNNTIRKQFIHSGSGVVSDRTRSLEVFAGFQNMIQRVKPTGEPCGSCGGR